MFAFLPLLEYHPYTPFFELKRVKQAIYKVPDGKLLKVFVEIEGTTITTAKITGDFFMHPEEKIEALEQAVVGHEVDESAIEAAIQNAMTDGGVDVFGADAASIAKTIMMAAQS